MDRVEAICQVSTQRKNEIDRFERGEGEGETDRDEGYRTKRSYSFF